MLEPTSAASALIPAFNFGLHLKSCIQYHSFCVLNVHSIFNGYDGWITMKEVFPFQMKISSWLTHHQASIGVYDFLISDEYNWSHIKKYILALPSFIMVWIANQQIEAQKKKSASIHRKQTPNGSSGLINDFWSKMTSLCKKNINI